MKLPAGWVPGIEDKIVVSGSEDVGSEVKVDEVGCSYEVARRIAAILVTDQ